MDRAQRSARRVSRIGALAVVLGMGAAAVTSPHAASADPTPAPGPSSPKVPAVDSQQEPSGGAVGPDATEPDPEPDVSSAQAPASSGEPVSVSLGDSPPVTYESSGGALTSGTDEDTAAPTDAPDPATSGAAAAPTAASSPVESAAPSSRHPTAVTSSLGTRLATAPQSNGDLGGTDFVFDTTTVEAAPTADATETRGPVDRRVSTVLLETPYRGASSEAVVRPSPSAPRPAPAFAVPTAPPATGVKALPGTLINIASGVLTAALSPLAVPGPKPPVDPPMLWVLLAWVRRQFAGQPIAVSCTAPDADPRAGRAKLMLDEPRPLRVTGTATVTGATRTILEDLVALFTRLIQGGLTVDPDRPYTLDGVDRRSGAVTGSVNVDGPGTSPLSFEMVVAPQSGAATVDPLTGQWTFTPTPASRVQAFAISGAAEVTFAVIASLGRAATIPIVVSAPVHGAEAAAYPALDGVPVRGVRLAPNDVGYQVLVRHRPDEAAYETAVAVIDPASPAATVTAPVAGALSRFVFAPDHTAYSTTVVAHDAAGGPDLYAMTLIKPTGQSVTVPIDGVPVGDIAFGPDGLAYQTSYRHDTTTDTYLTTVTVVGADGHHVNVSVDGHPAGFGFGADGAAYQVTESRPFDLDGADNETTVAAITPAGSARIVARVPGAALEFAPAPDGAVLQTARTAGPHGYGYTLTRIADNVEPQTIPLPGAVVGSVAVTPAGTAAVTVRSAAPHQTPGEVVLVDPAGQVNRIALTERPRGGVEIAADGTARQTVRSGDVMVIDADTARIVDVEVARTPSVVGPDSTVYTHRNGATAASVVEVLRPDGTAAEIEAGGALFTAADASSAYSVMRGVQFAPDGTPYLFAGTREATGFNPFFGDFDGLEVSVIDPTTATATRLPVAGGDNGFLKFLSDNAFAYFAPTVHETAGVQTAVTFVDLAAPRAASVHIDGYFTDYTVGDDGTSYLVTNTDFDTVAGTTGGMYAMTVASADGTMWTTDPIDGTPYEAMATGPDGTVYQVVENTDGVSTGVIVSHPGSLTFTRIDLDGYPQSAVVFDSAGTGYVTTGTVDPAGGGLRTVVTVVAAPT